MNISGCLNKQDFAIQGYASSFLGGLLHQHHNPRMTKDEAKALLKTCMQELKTRFVISQPYFIYRFIEAGGVGEPEVMEV